MMTTSNEHNNAPAVPQGWKLVPIEPTDAIERCKNMPGHPPAWVDMMRSMRKALGAATSAPAPAQSFDEVWYSIDWNEWRMKPIRELIQMIHSKTAPASAQEPAHQYTHIGFDPGYEPAQEAGLIARQFDLICQAIDKADTVTMDGDYMLDSDDCIRVVRVMQALFDIAALRAKVAV